MGILSTLGRALIAPDPNQQVIAPDHNMKVTSPAVSAVAHLGGSPTARATSDTDLPYSKASIAKSLAGGRTTIDKAPFFPSTPFVAPPPDYESNWRLHNLDSKLLARLGPTELIQVLADLSPDVSRALWDFIRLCNPKWTITAYRTSKSRTAYVKGQAAVDDFIVYLNAKYGSVNVLFNRMYLTAFMRGAFFAELVLAEDGMTPLDISLPDPISARFRKQVDPVSGEYWELGQWQNKGFTALTRPTVLYVPIDPFPTSPYGRPLVTPALFVTLFLLGLLHDLRRVVAQQGYPRLDLLVKLEALKEMMPPNLEGDPTALKDWVETIVKQVADIYAGLEPDMAYVHTDVVEMKPPQGVLGSTNLNMVQEIIRFLERMASRALKTMPIMMGLSDAISESNANRQWEIMAAGVRSLQLLCSVTLERVFNLMLQAQGIPGVVRVEFGELRAAEALRDQQIQTMKDHNAMIEWQMGWKSFKEACNDAVGHDPELEEPLYLPAGAGGAAGGTLNFAQTSPESETGRSLLSSSQFNEIVARQVECVVARSVERSLRTMPLDGRTPVAATNGNGH